MNDFITNEQKTFITQTYKGFLDVNRRWFNSQENIDHEFLRHYLEDDEIGIELEEIGEDYINDRFNLGNKLLTQIVLNSGSSVNIYLDVFFDVRIKYVGIKLKVTGALNNYVNINNEQSFSLHYESFSKDRRDLTKNLVQKFSDFYQILIVNMLHGIIMNNQNNFKHLNGECR